MDINERLIILSGITASGKNTVGELLLKMCSYLQRTVSCTTRKPRAGEKEGVDYYFLEKIEFLGRARKGEFIEYREVHEQLYGTLYSELTKIWENQKVPLLLIDVQGALFLREKCSKAILFFIKPTSLEVIKERLLQRGGTSGSEIEIRLRTAEEEITYARLYDHIIDNPIGAPEKAAQQIIEILQELNPDLTM